MPPRADERQESTGASQATPATKAVRVTEPTEVDDPQAEGGRRTVAAGTVLYDVDADEADEWIAGGHAVDVSGPNASKAATEQQPAWNARPKAPGKPATER